MLSLPATASASTAIATATTAAIASILGLVNTHLTTVQLAAVHLGHRIGRIAIGFEGDETKSTRPSGVPVGDHFRFNDGTEPLKCLALLFPFAVSRDG